MNRKTKIIYILGSVLFGALAVISLYFGLIASGVITVQKPKIIIASGSATEEYTGSAVSNGSWKLVSGQLDEGHVLEVKVSGQQTAIGSSSNLFTVVVKDKNGRDVTSEYAIEYPHYR